MLYQLGAVQFDVQPVNIDRAMIATGSDYAVHDVMSAPKQREYMGPGDMLVRLSGRIFPHKFGMGGFPTLQAMASMGAPQMLIRGDGLVLGWMDVIRIRERDSFLDATGVGRVVDFDIEMVAANGAASAGAMISLLGALVSNLFG